jgi:hypothetical protein
MKENLKLRAKILRKQKQELIATQKTGDVGKAIMLQKYLNHSRDLWRYFHVAYCMAKGTPYEKIEKSTKPSNSLDKRKLKHIIKYLETRNY